MEGYFAYLKWEDSFLLDSEITLFINNSVKKTQEFYKIISINNNIQFSSLLKSPEEENRVMIKINPEKYKNIWDLFFLIKPYALKSIYIYNQSEDPISYLFSFRCLDKNKKVTGLGNIIQTELFQIYSTLKEIHNNNLANKR
ncbi:MAG TPA: hypothetical protein PLE45_12485 [Spirochaetota bacterium]|nr:hypothetical protein [Spirochaetota bacterium]HOL58126.1 hypothetical protein [Spirochaetota bacterium]HPP05603.1 hypothetical protein [Spirochaetota bacterium]